MTAANPALAALLDRADDTEIDPADLLAEIVAGGVVVPIDDTESVVFIHGQDGQPWLPAFVDAATCARDVPHARPYLCDAARLVDIAGRTGVRTMTVASATQCASVPLALVARAATPRD
ncbi:SseB family protein [Embleya sp. NPDC005575]|uniref:SseB family protein n=1 Tax=Embleya sp. NPDC005575 TaxID=3156892 RepID=UPI0033A0EE41